MEHLCRPARCQLAAARAGRAGAPGRARASGPRRRWSAAATAGPLASALARPRVGPAVRCLAGNLDRGGPADTTDATVVTPTIDTLGSPDPRMRALRPSVEAVIGDPCHVIIDMRSAPEYLGERFWPSGVRGPRRAGGAIRAGHGVRREACDHLLHGRWAGQPEVPRAEPPARLRGCAALMNPDVATDELSMTGPTQGLSSH